MIIEDIKHAESILHQIRYYRFSGYALQFRKSENSSNYVTGTTFGDTYQVYLFDEELRNILRPFLESKMPIWVICELLSFSNASKLYSAMYNSEQKIIAESMNTKPSTLKNHLRCLSALRNKCAHGARLYNCNFEFPAKLGMNFLKRNESVNSNSLFSYLLVLIRRLPTVEQQKKLWIA